MLRKSILAIALMLPLSGCGDDAQTIDCSMSTLSYNNFGSQFMTDYCTSCHDTSVSGASRNFAPVGVNFDTLELVQNQSNRVNLRAGEGTGMPPSSASSQPSSAERDLLSEWIVCGTN